MFPRDCERMKRRGPALGDGQKRSGVFRVGGDLWIESFSMKENWEVGFERG